MEIIIINSPHNKMIKITVHTLHQVAIYVKSDASEGQILVEYLEGLIVD